MGLKDQRGKTTRRDFLGAGAALAGAYGAASVGGLLTGASISLAADIKPPNFIIIYCDDLGYGDVGCFGSPAVSTPNIDRMAEQGARFTDYYSCNGICAGPR